MRVKGTAYHACLKSLGNQCGDAKTKAFLEAFLEQHPEFPRTVLQTTWIPMEQFLPLIDAITEEVYGGDTHSLWELGEFAAAWTLSDGPYRNLLDAADAQRFAGLAKAVYANFFDGGKARSEQHSDVVELWLDDIPARFRHLCIEYSFVGYFRHGFQLLGQRVRLQCVEGFSKGDARVHYRLHLRPSA